MDCVHIPSVNYSEFSERIFGKNFDISIPISGSIDITSRCNLRCIHCYIQGTCSEDDLTYQEMCDIIDQIADDGCLWLLITGGEPLVRPDFMDIYKYAKNKGMIITLFTNGTLVTPEIVDFLAEYPPHAVEVTLYGMTPDTYEKVTGVRNAFNSCMNGIKLLRERNITVKLKSMIFTTNHHELSEMRRYADTIDGSSFRYDCMINTKLDGSNEPAKLRLSPEEIVALDRADEKRMKDFQDFYRKYGKTPESDYLYTCGAGVNNFHISSTGRLSVCIVSREPDYDLRRGTFHEGFYEAIPAIRAKKRTRYSECQACEIKGLCEQCPAWSQLEHGDPEAKVDFLCRVAKLREAAIRNYEFIPAENKQ